MPPNILSYEGQVVVPFINRTFSPLTDNYQFNVPTVWINTAAKTAYLLVAKPANVADWIQLGGSSGLLNTITTPDTTVVTPVAGNINFLNGAGMNITGSGANVTFTSVGLGFTWTVVTLSTALANGMGFIANNGGGVVFTLPLTAAIGDIFAVNTITSGGFTIVQNAGQKIQYGDVATTVGVTGSLVSDTIGDSLIFVCTATNTNFLVLSSMGNITYN